MPNGLDYVIVVPSRRRVYTMATIRSLLPTAKVVVDEREEFEYATEVPRENLILHPPMDGFAHVYNWMLKHFQEKIIIELDDTFAYIKSMTGSYRRISRPLEVLAVIENTAQCCWDLGLPAMTWSRTTNTVLIDPEMKPIVPIQPVCGALGVMHNGREREIDPAFFGRADTDWTLKTLLIDRCVYADQRFYFERGPAYAGVGGNTGLVSDEQFWSGTVGMKKKWGKHLKCSRQAYKKDQARNVAPIGMRVKRTNPIAQK
jgi:hypothetical protein